MVATGHVDGARVSILGDVPIVVVGQPEVRVVEWFGSTAPTVGVKLAVDCLPVVLAADQVPLPLSPDAATETTLVQVRSYADLINQGILDLINRTPMIGQNTSAGSSPVVIASDQSPIAVTDGGGSLTVDGTVGIGTWLGSAAPTVGQKAMAASLPVVIANDQSPVTSPDTPPDALGPQPAVASSVVVKATPGTLWTVYALSTSNQDVWLMTFNATALPANGTAPLDVVQIPRSGNGQAGIFIPRVHTTGIVVAASTTATTLTLAGAVLLIRPRYT